MAQSNFCVLSTNASLRNKCLYIEFSLDVDEDTINDTAFTLINQASRTIIPYKAEVDGKVVTLNLFEWLQPGDRYTLLVQGTIESIVGDPLTKTMMRTLTFESEVVSVVELTSPSNFEKISKVYLSWEETGDVLEKRYYIEIAKENAFYNLVHSTIVTGQNEITLHDMEDGQYFARVRADRGGDNYGKWSETVTFLLEKTEANPDEPEIPEGNEPDISEPEISIDDEFGPTIIEDIKPLEIDTVPVSGETPKNSFLFAFSENIDISEATVTIYRRDF